MNLRSFFTALLLVLVAALWAGAGAASATVVTTLGTNLHTGTIEAETGSTELHASSFSVKCSKSSIVGTVEAHGEAITANGKLSSLAFSECSNTVTVLSPGTLEAHGTSEGNGSLTSSGAEITIHGPFGINCLYKTNSTEIGTLTGSSTTESSAKIDLNSSLIPRTGDSAFCGSSGTWTGSYEIVKPFTLTLDQPAPAPKIELESADKFNFEAGKPALKIKVYDDGSELAYAIDAVSPAAHGTSGWENGGGDCAGKKVASSAKKMLICEQSIKCTKAGDGTIQVHVSLGKAKDIYEPAVKCK